ncbi:MAG: DegT/DnrJ/EryC1/StrS aminotransferase family protein [Actinobacteria bacterium]|nr:DegT/DnrJ/EryC1/StrS aminotransferase family protein [Actinomycetota bacterium]
MIPLFRPYFRIDECLNEIRGTLEKGWTGQGFLTEDFEKAWARAVNRENCLMLNSASSALHLALEALKINRGWSDDSEIISTPLTFVATNHAIFWSGLVPVLVDVDDDLCLSPEALLENINEKTKAVMFVAIGGGIGRIEEIKSICDEKGIALILDASHGSGSMNLNEPIGTGCDAICYSFQAVKNLPTGDSGALSMLHSEEHDLAKKLSWLGISESTFSRSKSGGYKWEYDVDHVGYKYNANAIMAAVALVSLKYLDEDNEKRRNIARKYQEAIQSDNRIEVIQQSNSNESSRHLFQVYVKDRSKVASAFLVNQIGMGVHYRSNCEYKMYSQFKKSTTNASRLSEGILTLPMFIEITDEEQSKVIETLLSAL